MIRSRTVAVLVSLLALVGVLAGCGDDDTVDSAASTEATEESAPAAEEVDWQADAPSEWDEALECAADEGSVTIAGPAQLQDVLAEAFQRDTGIDLELVTGEYGDIYARWAREAEAGNLTIDVLLGSRSPLRDVLPAGRLEAIKPQLLLPHVLEGDNWRAGEIVWIDNAQEHLPRTTGQVIPPLFVNSDVIDPAEITSSEDLLKPEYKGKIAVFDPLSSPGTTVAVDVAHFAGMETLTGIYVDQEPRIVKDGRQLVELAARGTHPIILGAIAPNIERFLAEGFKLEAVRLADVPGSIAGGFSVPAQAKNSPHPCAATVFLNWFLSKPGQETYSKALLEPSERADVSWDGVPEYILPEEGVDYLDQVSEDFYLGEYRTVQKQLEESLGGR